MDASSDRAIINELLSPGIDIDAILDEHEITIHQLAEITEHPIAQRAVRALETVAAFRARAWAARNRDRATHILECVAFNPETPPETARKAATTLLRLASADARATRAPQTTPERPPSPRPPRNEHTTGCTTARDAPHRTPEQHALRFIHSDPPPSATHDAPQPTSGALCPKDGAPSENRETDAHTIPGRPPESLHTSTADAANEPRIARASHPTDPAKPPNQPRPQPRASPNQLTNEFSESRPPSQPPSEQAHATPIPGSPDSPCFGLRVPCR